MRVGARALLLSAGAAAAFRLSAVPPLHGLSAVAATPTAPLVSASRSLAGLRASADAGLEAQIKSTIAESKVVVYSKSWCPFCQRTKGLFDQLGVEYTAIELDEVADGPAIQEALLGLTQQRTVPNVFVGGNHIGGNDDTMRAAQSGKLQEMLK